MNRSDIYADPVKLKSAPEKEAEDMVYSSGERDADRDSLLCGIFVYQSRLDLMQRLPWKADEIKNVEISEEKQEQMSGYWTIAVFGVDSRNLSVGKGQQLGCQYSLQHRSGNR